MQLRILQLNEDKTNPLFSSEESQKLLSIYEDYYPKIGFLIPWVAYLIIEENKVVGTCSFIGKPVDNKVEIAYWTFKAYESKGIASFACKELIQIAYEIDANILITAKTAPEENASTKILKKNGFTFSKIVQDEEIGDAWYWTLTKLE